LIVTTPLGGAGVGVGVGVGEGVVGVGVTGVLLESVELPQPHALRLDKIMTVAMSARMLIPLFCCLPSPYLFSD
jgi:hypothetical protein